MVDYIRNVITQFGGRYFGSEQEKKAQHYTAEILKNYCDNVEVQEFMSPLEAHFQSLKIFCIVYVIALALFFVNAYAAAAVALLNGVLFLGHFVTYRHWLDFLFKKKASWNVIGNIEPAEKAATTLIIAGHIDSVKEFKWWYKLKHAGAVLSVIAGFLLVLQGVYMLVAALAGPGWVHYIWWFFAIAAPILIVFFDMHGKNVVHGALDNLTGVAMAVEMAKVFSGEKLKKTRIRVISFGSEEAALRGSWAYAKQNRQQLLAEKALLFNLDTIKDKEHLTVVTKEINTLVSYEKKYVKLVEDAFKAEGVAYKKLPVGVGASDASAFDIQGIPAVCVIGMESERLDPCYHTRLDCLDNLTQDAMNELKKVLIRFVHEWDNGNYKVLSEQ
jgi:hypothetical protein